MTWWLSKKCCSLRPFGARTKCGELTRASYNNVVPHFCSPTMRQLVYLVRTENGPNASSLTDQAGPFTLSVATFFSIRFAAFVSMSEHQLNSVSQPRRAFAQLNPCTRAGKHKGPGPFAACSGRRGPPYSSRGARRRRTASGRGFAGRPLSRRRASASCCPASMRLPATRLVAFSGSRAATAARWKTKLCLLVSYVGR